MIQYDNGLGSLITVNNPLNSWTAQVQMNEGDNMFITAVGAATTGTLTISALGEPGTGNPVSDLVTENGDGTSTVYTLATTPVTLP